MNTITNVGRACAHVCLCVCVCVCARENARMFNREARSLMCICAVRFCRFAADFWGCARVRRCRRRRRGGADGTIGVRTVRPTAAAGRSMSTMEVNAVKRAEAKFLDVDARHRNYRPVLNARAQPNLSHSRVHCARFKMTLCRRAEMFKFWANVSVCAGRHAPPRIEPTHNMPGGWSAVRAYSFRYCNSKRCVLCRREP